MKWKDLAEKYLFDWRSVGVWFVVFQLIAVHRYVNRGDEWTILLIPAAIVAAVYLVRFIYGLIFLDAVPAVLTWILTFLFFSAGFIYLMYSFFGFSKEFLLYVGLIVTMGIGSYISWETVIGKGEKSLYQEKWLRYGVVILVIAALAIVMLSYFDPEQKLTVSKWIAPIVDSIDSMRWEDWLNYLLPN